MRYPDMDQVMIVGKTPASATPPHSEVMNRFLAQSEIFFLSELFLGLASVPRFPLAQYNSFQVHHNFICTISPFHSVEAAVRC